MRVQVKLLTPTPKAEMGSEVSIELEPDTPMPLLRARLAAATGLAVERQKVMLAGIGRLVLADKGTNIGFSHCGSTNNLYFATLPGVDAPTDKKT